MIISTTTLVSQLRYQFAEVELDILLQNNGVRISTVSSMGKVLVYAVSLFPLVMDQELDTVKDEVLSGGLIGETIEKHGFQFMKEIYCVCKIKDFPLFSKSQYSLVQFSEVYAKRNNKAMLFCHLLEVLNSGIKYEISTIDPDAHYFNTMRQVISHSIYPIRLENSKRFYEDI